VSIFEVAFMILVEMPETPGPLDEDRFDISSSIVFVSNCSNSNSLLYSWIHFSFRQSVY